MSKRRAFAPCLETTERRFLMTAGVVAGIAPAAAIPPISLPARRVHLAGWISGTFTQPDTSQIPDAGAVFNLTGQGKIAGMGNFAVGAASELHATGFIPRGRAGGVLTLSSASGTINLRLTGPLQRGFSPLPTTFSYVVESGTLDGRTIRDHGFLRLTMVPNSAAGTSGVFSIRVRSSV